MKARRHYLKFTDEMKRTVRRFIIYGQYRSRGIIQDRVDISHRPVVVEEKRRFGDFEIDTIIGKAHRANDAAVLEAYGFPKDATESDIVARLFKMYQELTK